MTEAEAIMGSAVPVTVESLERDLRVLGVCPGDVLLVHASLSALGWVCGGAPAVIEGMLRALGSEGTLVMPAYSSDLSEPSNWSNPPVPDAWWPTIRTTLPAFDPRRTPTRAMGRIAELFRTWPGVERSDHPTSSMAAMGPRASAVLERHPIDDPLGKDSPLARLYELDARVLLLGVGHGKNTSLHLAERIAFAGSQARVETGAPVYEHGTRKWLAYREPFACTEDFEALGDAFEALPGRVARVKAARLMSQVQLVDFATQWLRANRDAEGRPLGAS